MNNEIKANETLNIFNRWIEIHLISKETLQEFVLDSENCYLTVVSKKFLGFVKDEMTISIYNLDSKRLNMLLNNKIDFVKVYAGYGDKGNIINSLIAFNKILVMTVDKSDPITPKINVICSAKFNPVTKNALHINAGQSLYNTIDLLCQRMKVKALIDKRLKNKRLQKELVVQHEKTAINQLIRDYDYLKVYNDTLDKQYDLEFKIVENSENQIIKIDPLKGTLIKSWIDLDSRGNINFYALPVIEFNIGTLVEVDRNYLNQTIESADQYLDLKKQNNILNRTENNNDNKLIYIIYQLEYSLDVRGEFSIKILARPYNKAINWGATV